MFEGESLRERDLLPLVRDEHRLRQCVVALPRLSSAGIPERLQERGAKETHEA
jgi:hypothetical protein